MSTTTPNYIHRDDLTEAELEELKQILGCENIICAGDGALSDGTLAEIAELEAELTARALEGDCGYCAAHLNMIAELTGAQIARSGWRMFESQDGMQMMLLCPEHCTAIQLESGDVIPPLWQGVSLN